MTLEKCLNASGLLIYQRMLFTRLMSGLSYLGVCCFDSLVQIAKIMKLSESLLHGSKNLI